MQRPDRTALADDGSLDQRVGPMAALPEMLRSLGVDPALVLADCALAPDALTSAEGRIAFPAVGALLEAATARTGCEHFALRFGQRMQLAQLGALGELARHAPTVGAALDTVAVYQSLNSRGAMSFVVTEGEDAVLGYTLYRAPTAGADLVQDAVLALLLNAMRELLGPAWLPGEFLLARREPASRAVYRRAFESALQFDAEYTGMRFDVADLRRVPPAADPRRFAAAEARIAAALQRDPIDDLRRVLRVDMLRRQVSADRVAQVLAMHRRTLSRRLRDQGTSFQRVLDEVRFDTARHLLEVSAMPVTQIGHALGYADGTAFIRAFRRWSGVAPGRFRDAPPAGILTR